MQIPVFFVDAFTDQPFKGNPAAVCYLHKDLDKSQKQNIAFEIGFSETAFILQTDFPWEYRISWFTPKTEVNLCGHATLSAAKIIFEFYGQTLQEITFHSISGDLICRKNDDLIELDFPLDEPLISEQKYPDVAQALGLKTKYDCFTCPKTGNLLFKIQDQNELCSLNPDFEKLASINISPYSGIIVTSPGDNDFDFLSRYFTPWEGINEDPVTGSAHTCLLPLWSKILDKKKLCAKQISQRSGILFLELTENRALIRGNAVIILQGNLENVI